MVNLSVVLYNTSKDDIMNVLESLKLINIPFNFYVIDNSPEDILKQFFINKDNFYYIHNPSNPGFGASHNIALSESIKLKAKYHFVINPDAFFKEDVVSKMVQYMEVHKNVGMMMPQILNLDGTIQNLPKLLPSPYSLLMRKIKRPNFIYQKFIQKYELRNISPSSIYKAPILSGCFTLFRVDALKDVGLYDDRFFMYFEDWDLSRRMHEKFDTIYYPMVSVYHAYESGANKNKRLFKIFINSAISYFKKWGWVDHNRKKINRDTLKQFV